MRNTDHTSSQDETKEKAKAEEEKEKEEEEEEVKADIKSNNPHLTGGEKSQVVFHLEMIHLGDNTSPTPPQILNPMWMFPKIGVPQNGWFIMEIKMDDLGVPLVLETPMYLVGLCLPQ